MGPRANQQLYRALRLLGRILRGTTLEGIARDLRVTERQALRYIRALQAAGCPLEVSPIEHRTPRHYRATSRAELASWLAGGHGYSSKR